MIKAPINLAGWIEENRELLKPPVGNKKIYEDQGFMIFIVGGPNSRKDYHINTTEEFFHQLEGTMTLKVVEDGVHRDIPIGPGELFLLPPNIPHSPRRPAGTIGLVIELKRPADAVDGLRWYCESCGEVLHERFLPMRDIVGQLTEALEAFMADEALRTCDHCGARMEF